MAKKIKNSFKKVSPKVIPTFIGVLILISGLVAAVVTVLNPQLFSQRAQMVGYTCSGECTGVNLPGTYSCTTGSGIKQYCCPNGQRVINAKCVVNPDSCASNSNCAPYVSSTASGPSGSTPCYKSGSLQFCCPIGSVVYNNSCTKCGKSECDTANRTECINYNDSAGYLHSYKRICTTIQGLKGCPTLNVYKILYQCLNKKDCKCNH